MSGETFYTADPHFGHNRVASRRGFASSAEHDQALCDNWAARVRPRDIVIILGDLALSNVTGALALVGKLPGTKHLIVGNHDGCHPMYVRSHAMARRYMLEGGFASIQMAARRQIAGHHVLLSHFPYRADHTEEVRFAQWRLPDLGRWLLHGHVHSPLRRTSDREIHVGVDAWGLAPVPSAEVAALMTMMMTGP